MITLIFQQKDWAAAASSKDTGTNLTVFDELGLHYYSSLCMNRVGRVYQS